MKKLLLFILVFLSLGANAQLLQLSGGGGGLNGGSGGSGGGGGGATVVIGTPNQIISISGPGTATLSTPQDIHFGASPTFVSGTFTGLLPSAYVRTDASSGLSSVASIPFSDVTGIVPVAQGGSGLDASSAANGTFLIGNGSGFDLNVVSGTTNQVIATPSAGGLTLSAPQDIHSGASPTFVSATFSGTLPNAYVKTDGASGLDTATTIPLSDLTGILPQTQGGTGVDASALANGEIFVGNGAGFVSATVTGTLNQVAVANGAGSITLSTPQDIHSGASPTFVSATFSGTLPNAYVKTDGASGLDTVASIPLSDLTGILPQAQGGTGVDASALANGEIFIGNGAGFVSSSITGTLNQVAVANGAGSITLSAPQDIHSGASPTFVSATFSGVLPNEFVKTDGASGLTSVASIDLTADVGATILPIANGGTNSSTALNNDRMVLSSGGAIVEGSALTDGQFFIGATAGSPAPGTIAGTANQVDVTYASNSITASLPQDIHSGASPTFVSATFTGLLPNEFVKTDGASGLTTSASIDFSDLTGVVPQDQGGTGVDASALGNGEIFIGNGTGFVSATVTGTLNQVAVTNGAGSITLSTPQDIDATASPTFVSATFTGLLPNQFIKTDGASGVSTSATISLTSEIDGVLPIANGGTNSATALVNNQLTYSNAGAIEELGAMTTGEFVVGVSGSAPSIVAMSGDATFDATGAILLDDDASAKTLMARIGTPTYSSIQETHDITSSTGVVTGGMITDAGAGTIDVSSGSGLIRASNSETSQLVHFDWVADTSIALVDGVVANYVYVEYNAGAPQVVVTTTKRADLNTNILLGYVLRNGTTLNISESSEIKASNGSALIAKRLIDTNPFIVSTLNPPSLADEGSQNFSLSAGTFWEGLTEFTTTAFDSSGADTFSYFYRDGGGGWTEVTGQTIIDRENWDDGTGTLNSIANNRRANHWIYVTQDSKVYVLYGRGDYTLANANAALPPSDLPPQISVENHGRLIGKITSRGNTVAFETVELRLNSQEVSSFVPTSHTSLADLVSTDDHTQYVLNTGRTGGQSMIGGLDASNNLTIDSTSNATKGNIILNASGGKVSVGTAAPHTSAVVDVTSIDKGFLPPRMTEAQRDAITTPASGLVLFNTDTNQLNYYNGTGWISY